MMSSVNSSLLKTLFQQNEIQRAILNEMIALNGNHYASAAGTQPHYYSQSNMNGGNTGNRSSSKEISSYLVYNYFANLICRSLFYYMINRGLMEILLCLHF